MIDAALQITSALSAFIVLVRAEPALSRMSGSTHPLIRLSVWLLVVGAAARLGSIVLYGIVPPAYEVITAAGVALLLLCERRVRILVPLGRKRATPEGGQQ
jgi:membrane protein YqaA with SNARE-associated domain